MEKMRIRTNVRMFKIMHMPIKVGICTCATNANSQILLGINYAPIINKFFFSKNILCLKNNKIVTEI